MSEDETKTEEIQQVEKDEITEQAWWRESAFVYKGETETVESSGAVLKPNTLFDTLKDITPALREEGESILLGRTFTGFTEWIAGVDPVGELMEDTWLPPLPPSVTTKMRTFVDDEGELPLGGGHLNMIVDLSGSMSEPIGLNNSKVSVSIRDAAMTMCYILVNGCKNGGHTFSMAGYGSSRGNITIADVDSQESYWRSVGTTTRLIWGVDASQRKDYQGAMSSILNAFDESAIGNAPKLWSYMGGTQSGAGMARMYWYMKERMKGTEVTTAPCIFLSDCLPGDLSVDADCYTLANDNPDNPILNTAKMEEEGATSYGNSGFWYWAKRYNKEFGPVILIQMVSQSDAKRWQNEKVSGGAKYLKLMDAAFVQYLGAGQPPDEYKKCFFTTINPPKDPNGAGGVFMDGNGGNLIEIARRLNEFIKNMNGEGEICCGGKGISF